MLARNFKAATDLGLKADQYSALLSVLGMMERGEIPAERFDMRAVSHHGACGTVYCIAGWCEHISDRRIWDYGLRTPNAAIELFMFGDERRYNVTLDQGIQGLTNYLRTGDANWDAVLGVP